jgi:hypothetical protein
MGALPHSAVRKRHFPDGRRVAPYNIELSVIARTARRGTPVIGAPPHRSQQVER